MSFTERYKQHDTKALPLVRSVFEAHGFTFFRFGGELAPELQEMLRCLQDSTSRMLRYRPDGVAVSMVKGTLLVEIKSETTGSPNFAVEFDAWDAIKLWNYGARRALYVFADIHAREVLACWPEELNPQKIFVPRKDDYHRIKEICPGIELKFCPWAGGSGTPFFLAAKQELNPLSSILDKWTASYPSPATDILARIPPPPTGKSIKI